MDYIPSRPITDKCIILDVDETLIHGVEHYTSGSQPFRIFNDPRAVTVRHRIHTFIVNDSTKPRGAGQATQMAVIERPGLHEFLHFCFSYFRVIAIWSAGTRPYVRKVVEQIFRPYRPPMLIYARENCVDNDSHTEKPIEMMMDDYVVEPYMTLANTLIVDDRDTNFKFCNPDNGICIPPYKPRLSLDGIAEDDDALIQLCDWLARPDIIDAADVRQLDKSDIFA